MVERKSKFKKLTENMKKTIGILLIIISFYSCQNKKIETSKKDSLTTKIEHKEKEIKLKELELKEKELSNSLNKFKKKKENPENKSALINQKKIKKNPIKDDKVILNIRNVFKTINNNINQYEVKKIYLDESSEGGELLAYLKNGKIKKLEVKQYGHMGQWLFDYYFSDEQLVFAFSQNIKYNKPATMEGSKISERKENRYYFHKYLLYKWLDPNNEEVSKSIYEEKGNELNRNVFELKRKIQGN